MWISGLSVSFWRKCDMKVLCNLYVKFHPGAADKGEVIKYYFSWMTDKVGFGSVGFNTPEDPPVIRLLIVNF